VGGDADDSPLVNLPKFGGSFPGGAGHAAHDRVLAKETLETEAGEGLFVGSDGHAFFYFHGLMQAPTPRKILPYFAPGLVDDLNFFVFGHEVLFIADEAVLTDQCLGDQFFTPAFAFPEAVAAGNVFQPILPALGEIDRADFAVDDKVAVFLKLHGKIVSG